MRKPEKRSPIADYANLARRWIDGQLADLARIRRVDSDTGRLLYGSAGSTDRTRAWQSHTSSRRVPRPREWRLRRDHPDIEYKDGKPKERGKYYVAARSKEHDLLRARRCPRSW